jgi:hypothetical protein
MKPKQHGGIGMLQLRGVRQQAQRYSAGVSDCRKSDQIRRIEEAQKATGV